MAKTELSAIVIFDVQPLKSLHLQKDVGLIPSSIAAQTKQEALLLCLQGDESQATLLRAGLSRVGLRRVPRRFGRGSSLDSLSYALNALSMLRALATEAKRSRLLLVFHARPAFVLYALLYRCLNPGGTVWLKLDLDDGTLEHFLKKRIRFATYVRVADIVSVETRPIQKRLNAAFGHIRQGCVRARRL